MTFDSLRIGALVAAGLATGWVVRDGSFQWQLIRLVVVVAATLLAVNAVDGVSRRRRGGILFAAAIVALSVGGGIAPAWVTKTGFTITSVAGVVALAAGIVLLVFGIGDLVPATGRWRKTAAGFGIGVVTMLLVFSSAIAIAVTNVPPGDIGETPADRGLDAGDLTLITEDGVELAAWYVPSQNGAAVVLLHGAGSTRSSVLDEMQVLARHGYGVLAYDARGHGDSDGRAMDFGWFGNWDTFPAVDWLLQSPDVDPERIGIVGMSMGGEVAIGTAAFHGKVKVVVAEGATGRTAADKTWLTDVYGPQGWVQRGLDVVTYGLTDLFTETSSPTSLRDAARRTAPRPILLIAAGDVPDETHAAEWIASVSPDTVQIWTIPDAGHIGGLDTAPAEWEQRVIDFLNDAIG